MVNLSNLIWVEKYRPRHVKDVIMPNEYLTYFQKMIASGNSNNLLLSSPIPGTGKSSIAKAIANDLNANVLYINASSDNGIAVARDQIAEFAQTRSIEIGKSKIVILDEADGLTPQFQAALRGYIEQYSKTCRFILTCNYISKIIEPLREGRTHVFDFNMSKKEYKQEVSAKMIQRLAGILDHEHVEYDANCLKNIVEALYPSMRKMITLLQKYYEMHGKIDDGILSFKSISSELDDLIKAKKLTEARNYINSNGYSCTDVFSYLFNNYIPNMDAKLKAQAILILGQWEPQCALSSMPDLMIACALLEIMKLES